MEQGTYKGCESDKSIWANFTGMKATNLGWWGYRFLPYENLTGIGWVIFKKMSAWCGFDGAVLPSRWELEILKRR